MAHHMPVGAAARFAAEPRSLTHSSSLFEPWRERRPATFPEMDRHVTENVLRFAGGVIELSRFSWSTPLESVCQMKDRGVMLYLRLSGWVAGMEAATARAPARAAQAAVGHMFLVPAGQEVRLASRAGDTRSILCMLDADLFDDLVDDAGDASAGGIALTTTLDLNATRIEWLLRRMADELHRTGIGMRVAVEAMAKQLAVEVARVSARAPAARTSHGCALAPWRLLAIQQRLASEQALPDREELARLCGLTVRHLGRAFLQQTGMTLGQKIDEVMVLRARRMLLAGMQVRHVAARLGYSSSCSFASAFRRATGMRPSSVN